MEGAAGSHISLQLGPEIFVWRCIYVGKTLYLLEIKRSETRG